MKKIYVITYSCLFLLSSFYACNQLEGNKSFEETSNLDSIASWVHHAQNLTYSSSIREEQLNKAYNKSLLIIDDSIKNSQLLNIINASYLLDSLNLFKLSCQKALAVSKEINDSLSQAKVHYFLGLGHLKSKKIDSSYLHFYTSNKFISNLRDTTILGHILYGMAYSRYSANDYTGSELLALLAVDSFKKSNDLLSLNECYNLLGLISLKLEEYDNSLNYYIKSKKAIATLPSNEIKNLYTNNNIGLLFQKKGDQKIAIAYFKEVLQYKTIQQLDIVHYARVLNNLGYSQLLMGDSSNALKLLTSALKIRDSIGEEYDLSTSKLRIAEYYLYKKDSSKALEYAKESLKLSESVNNNTQLKALTLLSEIDNDNAPLYLDNYITLKEKLQTKERVTRNKFSRIQFETDKHIEATEKLSNQKIIIAIISMIALTILSLLYYIKIQRSKNSELLFDKDQQKSNEEIYRLMLKQQSTINKGRIKERHRIAEELHDGIIGRIFGTRLTFGLLNFNGNKTEVEKFDLLIKELQEIEKEVRDISHLLKNDKLIAQQNFNAIIKLLLKKQKSHTNLDYTIIIDDKINWNIIDSNFKINLYRIIQEVIKCCQEFSMATKIELHFKQKKKSLTLTIKDNAKNTYSKSYKKNIHFINIQSRIEKLHGKIEIQTDPIKGTLIKTNLPL